MSFDVHMSVIALNCRSLNNKLGEIKLLIYTQKPDIVAFTETWLADNSRYNPKFIGYSTEFKNRAGFASGMGFLIKHGVQYQNISLIHYQNGYLECQVIKIMIRGGQYLGVLNVYNPGRPVTSDEFKHYIAQVGNKFVIVGDFNCHSRLLDSNV